MSATLEGDDVDGAIELAVSAPVEAVAGRHARTRRDRGHACERREGRFARNAVPVRPRAENGGSDDRADAVELEEIGAPTRDQLADLCLVTVRLGMKARDTPSEISDRCGVDGGLAVPATKDADP